MRFDIQQRHNSKTNARIKTNNIPLEIYFFEIGTKMKKSLNDFNFLDLTDLFEKYLLEIRGIKRWLILPANAIFFRPSIKFNEETFPKVFFKIIFLHQSYKFL